MAKPATQKILLPSALGITEGIRAVLPQWCSRLRRWGPWPDSINITRELDGNAGLRPTESETPGVGPAVCV